MMGDAVDRVAGLSGCDVDRGLVLLTALVADEIETLARLHRRGIWREDPAEIGDWLRRHPSANLGRFEFLEAFEEWRLWGAATDALLRKLVATTPVRLTRAGLVAMAKARSSERGRASSTAGTMMMAERRWG